MPDYCWQDWSEDETPYLDWWVYADSKRREVVRDFVTLDDIPRFDPSASRGRPRSALAGGDSASKGATELAKQYFGNGVRVPVPRGSLNPDWPREPDIVIDPTPDPVLRKLPDDLEDDTVIVGVIDTGVALGHRAFRLGDGRTRVIASWQQSAQFGVQGYLPFGQEVYAGDIDDAIAAHSRGGDRMKRLDEEVFNRSLRLVEPRRIRGQRDLDHRAAHGTHVMDLAAGHPPASDEARRVRLIVVNLPTQFLHGSAGNFLMYWAAFAVARIFDLTAALWRVNRGSAKGGYPLALNLAYGMMAGPKDGSMPLERFMEDLVQARCGLPTSICLPAGNENLARAVAPQQVAAGKWSCAWLWRTLPSDRTSNFLEFWIDLGPSTQTVETAPGSASEAQTGQLWSDHDLTRMEFSIEAPNGARFELRNPVDNRFCHLTGVQARLYCRVERENDAPRRLQFLLASAPTLVLTSEPDVPQSPAGVWKIRIRTPRQASIYAYVQSDQSSTVHSFAGLDSYLEDDAYERFEPGGRLKDSFSYLPGKPPMSQETGESLVTRFGTQNALATTTANSAIAGYRFSDGRPASYSATGAGLFPQLVLAIQAAYVTEDGPAHYGVLAAGARDGASVAFRGTSMAAAKATRNAVRGMLEWLNDRRPDSVGIGSVTWHQQQGSSGELNKLASYAAAAEEKIGAGRVGDTPRTDHRVGRPDRVGRILPWREKVEGAARAPSFSRPLSGSPR